MAKQVGGVSEIKPVDVNLHLHAFVGCRAWRVNTQGQAWFSLQEVHHVRLKFFPKNAAFPQ